MNEANDPFRSLDQFDGCPADTMTTTIQGEIVPAEPEDCAWAVLVCYTGIGPRLMGFETKADALTHIDENTGRRPMYLVCVKVPAK